MDPSVYVCDTKHCCNLADKFILGERGGKSKACPTHTAGLLAKKRTLYDIEAFDFIQSAGDVSLYESRRREGLIARNNLKVLEVACDAELRQAEEALDEAKIKVLKVVEAAFLECKSQTKRKHQEMMKQMGQMRANLEQYRLNKEAHLTDTEQSLQRDLEVIPRFLRIVVTDPSFTLAKAILDSCLCLAVEQPLCVLDVTDRKIMIERLIASAEISVRNGRETVAAEKKDYAIALGSAEGRIDLSKRQFSEKRKLARLLESSWDAEEVREVATYYAEKATQECVAQHWEKAASLFKKSVRLLNLRFPTEKETAKINFRLGVLVLEQWSPNTEAVAALQQSLNIEEALDPFSEDTGKARNMLVSALIQDARYVETEPLLRLAIKNTKGRSSLGVSLCYLALVYAKTDRVVYANELVQVCVEKLDTSTAEDKACMFFTLGEVFTQFQQYAGAEQMYITSLKIYESRCPNSFYIAHTLRELGNIYLHLSRLREAEVAYQRALAILTCNFPNSILTVRTLLSIGQIYECMAECGLSLEEPEQKSKNALRILITHFPALELTAITFGSLGRIYIRLTRYEEAELLCKEALERLKVNFPNSSFIPFTLMYLGVISQELDRIPEAISYMKSASMIWKQAGSQDFAEPALESLYSKQRPSNLGALFRYLFS